LLKNAAIATSGRGPRDFAGNQYRSATISPFTGHPVSEVISVSAVASHAADADAIATACMVLCPNDSLALINRLDGVAVRITDVHGRVHQSSGWPAIRLAATSLQQPAPSTKPPSLPPELRWPDDWELGINYIAPDRQDSRSAEFRTPFMVLWITDAQNHPVRTLFMIGKDAEWQRDNFIWWGLHRQRAKQLVDLRSQSTSMSGRYPVYWPGVDDDWQSVPLGKYTLHVETSQERGKHSYRSIPIELGHQRFKAQLPNLPDSGGIEITYGHYNDRFNSDD
jgi:thiamine biosynthesis lipoprotein